MYRTGGPVSKCTVLAALSPNVPYWWPCLQMYRTGGPVSKCTVLAALSPNVPYWRPCLQMYRTGGPVSKCTVLAALSLNVPYWRPCLQMYRTGDPVSKSAYFLSPEAVNYTIHNFTGCLISSLVITYLHFVFHSNWQGWFKMHSG